MRRNMFRLAAAVAAAVVAATGVAAAETQAKAEAKAAAKVSAITIDGGVSDWKGVAALASETEPKVTGVAQDETFLYAYFRSGDLDLARRVLRSGAIVWVNLRGVHGEGYGVRFRGTEKVQQAVDEAAKAQASPVDDSAASAQSGGGQAATGQGGSGRRRSAQGGTPRAALGTVEVLRDGAVNELITTGARDGGPAAACRFADGEVVYEFRLPLAEMGLPAGGERAVAVGFQMSGRTQAERRAAADRQGSRHQRTATPPPWGEPAPASSGEAKDDAEGAASGAPEGAADTTVGGRTARGSDSSGAADAGDGRRRNYPTVWCDVAVVTAPAAAAK